MSRSALMQDFGGVLLNFGFWTLKQEQRPKARFLLEQRLVEGPTDERVESEFAICCCLLSKAQAPMPTSYGSTFSGPNTADWKCLQMLWVFSRVETPFDVCWKPHLAKTELFSQR